MQQIVLSLADWIYLIFVIVIMSCLVARKNAVLPALVGLFLTGLALKGGNLFSAMQVTYKAILTAGVDLLSLILIVAAITTLTKIMADMGIDKLMVAPAKKLMRNPTMSFITLTIVTLLVSWVLRATPTVALIGSLLVPTAVLSGMSPIVAGLLLSIVGKGVALSSDFLAQGTPAVTAKATKLPLGDIFSASIPIWATVSIVSVILLYIKSIRLQKEDKKRRESGDTAYLKVFTETAVADEKVTTPFAKLMIVLIPVLFLADIYATIAFKLTGDDAMALMGGTFYLLSVICSIGYYKKKAFETLFAKIREGWTFSVKVFGPVVVIAGFFWLSGQSLKEIVGNPQMRGLAFDWGYFAAEHVPINKFMVTLLATVASGFAAFDGSGYAAIPIGANIALALGKPIGANVAYIAAMAQMSAIWVGATLVPWGFLALTASVTGTDPQELSRKSFGPVLLGLAAAAIVTAFLA
jgi:hypothetical protein